MAGDAKKLIVSFGLDTRELSKLDRVLNQFKGKFSDIAKGLKGSFGDLTKDNGRAGLMNALDTSVKKMEKLGLASKEMARISKDVMGRALDEQIARFDDLQSSVKSAEAGYRSLERQIAATSDPALKADLTQQRNRAGLTLLHRNQAMNTAADDLGKIGPNGGNILSALGGPLALGALVSAVITAIPKQLDAMNRLPLQLDSRGLGTTRAMSLAMQQGNFGQALAFHQIQSDPDKLKNFQEVTDPNSARHIAAAIWGASNKFSIGIGDGKPLIDFDVPGMVEAIKGRSAAAAQEGQDMISNQMISDPQMQAVMQMGSEMAGPRRDLIRQGVDVETGVRTGFANSFSQPETLQHISMLMSAGGRTGVGNLDSMQKAIRAGLDPSTAVALAGGASFGGKGAALADHFAYLSQNGMDKLSADRAGQFVNSHMFTGNGLQTGEGLSAFMSGGDVFSEHARERGVGALGGVLGGQDNYQRARSLTAAVGLTGNNFVAAEMLSKLDPVTAMDIIKGGAMPAHLKAAGITRDIVEQWFNTNMSSISDRVLTTNGGTDMDKLAGALRSHKITTSNLLKGGPEAQKLASTLGIRDLAGATDAVLVGSRMFDADSAIGLREGTQALNAHTGLKHGATDKGDGTDEDKIIRAKIQGEVEQWSLALRVASRSATDLADVFKDIIKDLEKKYFGQMPGSRNRGVPQ